MLVWARWWSDRHSFGVGMNNCMHPLQMLYRTALFAIDKCIDLYNSRLWWRLTNAWNTNQWVWKEEKRDSVCVSECGLLYFILCEAFLSHLIKSWHIKREIVNFVYTTRERIENGHFIPEAWMPACISNSCFWIWYFISICRPQNFEWEKENILLLKCHFIRIDYQLIRSFLDSFT